MQFQDCYFEKYDEFNIQKSELEDGISVRYISKL